jgi:peptidoglycan hydrolase-like protein with peptidoglycan-binding domain
MRSLGGFVLLAGIGVGLFVYFPAPVDSDTSLEQAKRAAETRIARFAQVAPATAKPTTSRLAAFSPRTPLTAPRTTARRAAPTPTVVAVAPKVDVAPAWQTSVTIAPTTVAAGSTGALDPNDPEARYQLVVDIQQQLKRAGCYWGRVNGSWNANTRDAMRSFTDRVNATLPIEKPDYLLLTLLKAHSGRACDACPAGEVAAAGGRCVPQAIVAQAQRKDAAVVASTTPEVLPWKAAGASVGQAAAPARLFTPVPTSVVSNEPLPGRMAIGGPRDFPPPQATQAPLIPGATTTPPNNVAAFTPPPGAGAAAPVAPRATAPKKQAWKKPARSRRDGPGTPRYNLMLTLGGVY